jgi:hypothetical protein
MKSPGAIRGQSGWETKTRLLADRTAGYVRSVLATALQRAHRIRAAKGTSQGLDALGGEAHHKRNEMSACPHYQMKRRDKKQTPAEAPVISRQRRCAGAAMEIYTRRGFGSERATPTRSPWPVRLRYVLAPASPSQSRLYQLCGVTLSGASGLDNLACYTFTS